MLAYTGDGTPSGSNHGFISTFTISSDGTTITEVDTLEHDTDLHATDNSLVHVASDTYALAYFQSNPSGGLISTFTIDGDGTITPIRIANHAAFESASDNFEHDPDGADYNSFVQVDSDTYALAYASKAGATNQEGFIATFTISSDGTTITEVASLHHDTDHGSHNSLVHVDSDTYALAYAGESSDGYISTFDISSAGTITAKKTQSEGNNLEHDQQAAKYNSLVKVDSETIALAYEDDVETEGSISTFTVNSAAEITGVKTDVAGTNVVHDTAFGLYNSFIQMESDLYVLASRGTGSDGFISTFKIDSDGVITAVKTHAAGNNVEHTLDDVRHNSLVKVDSETIALAYNQIGSGETGNEGFISTFDIGISKPSRVGTISPTSSAVLSWTAPTAGESDITDYIIQYSTDDSSWITFSDGVGTGTTATVTGLTSGTTYYFRVAAVNSSGTGAFSSSSSAAFNSSPGGGGSGNCDSRAFGLNKSLKVNQVSYDIETFELAVQAYSACGPILSKIFTSTEIGTLGLSMNQPLLDENIVIYSTYLEESDKKFRILLENDRNSFDETFYIYDKSIIKTYKGYSHYTSEQQGTIYQEPESTVEPMAEPEPTVEPTSEPGPVVELIVEPILEPTPEPEPIVEPEPTSVSEPEPEQLPETDTSMWYWFVIPGLLGMIFLLLYKRMHKNAKNVVSN